MDSMPNTKQEIEAEAERLVKQAGVWEKENPGLADKAGWKQLGQSWDDATKVESLPDDRLRKLAIEATQHANLLLVNLKCFGDCEFEYTRCMKSATDEIQQYLCALRAERCAADCVIGAFRGGFDPTI